MAGDRVAELSDLAVQRGQGGVAGLSGYVRLHLRQRTSLRNKRPFHDAHPRGNGRQPRGIGGDLLFVGDIDELKVIHQDVTGGVVDAGRDAESQDVGADREGLLDQPPLGPCRDVPLGPQQQFHAIGTNRAHANF
ncbi:hypothetical protein D3C71_1046350 [compost metagenome]